MLLPAAVEFHYHGRAKKLNAGLHVTICMHWLAQGTLISSRSVRRCKANDDPEAHACAESAVNFRQQVTQESKSFKLKRTRTKDAKICKTKFSINIGETACW